METRISEEKATTNSEEKPEEDELEEEEEEEQQSDEDEAQEGSADVEGGDEELKDEDGGDDGEDGGDDGEHGGDDGEDGGDDGEDGGDDGEDGGDDGEDGGDDGEDGGDDGEDGGDDGDIKRSSKVKGKAADKKCVPGIIYMGHVPPRLRPKHVRNMLSVYGEIGRIFLQPEGGAFTRGRLATPDRSHAPRVFTDRQVRARKKKSGLRRCDFTEGWVEFRDKRVAKRVAASLHNTPMATRKRQWIASDLWCMKYLHRFQWTHLSERLAYERSVLQQRLRTEISQAKRETNFYLENVDKSAHLERKRRREGPQAEGKSWEFPQRQTEEEIQSKKKRKQDSVAQRQRDKSRLMQQQSQSNVSLLAKIFNSTPVQ